VRRDRAKVAPEPSRPPEPLPPRPPHPDDEDRALRARLIELLTQHEGNVRAVAAVLGKERSQLYKWFERLGIDYKAFRPKS